MPPSSSKGPSVDPVGMASGDEVYATHPVHGALVLKVLAVGRDGFTAQDGKGARHKVKHEHYLGHRTRQLQAYRVVDTGADGSLLEGRDGKRRFLAGEMPKNPDAKPAQDKAKGTLGHAGDPLLDGLSGLLRKALAPLPGLPNGPLILLKATAPAGRLAHRPGLTQKRITDRSGRTENRWVRTMQDQPKARGGHKGEDDTEGKAKAGEAKPPPAKHKHGDVVSFRHGDVEGQGKIVASGQDGVRVETPDGREHPVRHDALLPDHPPQPKLGDEARHGLDRHGEAGQSKEGSDDAPLAPLFKPERTKGLPTAAKQPVSSKEELYAKAAEAQKQLEEFLNKGKCVASSLGYEHVKGSPDDADFSKPGGMLFIAPLKGEKRATEKVDQDYGGDWSQLLDPVRASLAVDRYDELPNVMAALEQAGMKLARQPKDRFAKPLPVGYRDALLNITLPNGLIGELQLHVKPMLTAKSEGHKHYETERSLQGKKATGLSDEEKATLQAAIDNQTEIYNAAWQASIGGGAQGGEAMAKALGEAGVAYTYFVHENAKFRRREQPPFRGVDDVLHGRAWVPYKGDVLKPALFGAEIPDPLGGKDKAG